MFDVVQFFLLISAMISWSPHAAHSQEPHHIDGILSFRDNGVSDIEFLIGENFGTNRLEILFSEGEPFSVEHGFCQIANIRQSGLILNHALGVNDEGNWVAIVAPRVREIDQTSTVFPVLGVQCFLGRR